MLRFFRKIRQNLLAENKFTKYLFYALGEIILVVIGILIALAINNANQKRLTEKNEETYLIGLKEEFQTSKLKLKELIAVNQSNYTGAKKNIEIYKRQCYAAFGRPVLKSVVFYIFYRYSF